MIKFDDLKQSQVRVSDDIRAINGFKQEKWMIEKFKEKILASSEAVRCRIGCCQSAHA